LLAGAALSEIGPWYHGLNKPTWQPPDWLFGPAWATIFAFVTGGAILAWNAAPDHGAHVTLLVLFAVNGVLNIAWSFLFFKRRRPDWALIEVVPLWLSIAALAICLGRITPIAGWLMLPYLGWVAFAAFLNLTIVRLNHNFSRL
jgi:tryptophan-rich sensory protein